MLSVIMLSVIMLSVVMLSVIMLNVVMLSVIMLNVVMLSMVAPSINLRHIDNSVILLLFANRIFTQQLIEFTVGYKTARGSRRAVQSPP